MKISVGVVVSLGALLLFGGVASSSIAEGKTSLSMQAKEKAIAHQEKGSTFDDEGNFAAAIEEFKKSLEYDSEEPNTLFNLGIVYLKTNKPSDAEKVFEKLSKILPNDSEVFNLLGIAHSGAENKQEAIQAWEKSLALQPDQQKVKDMITEMKTVAANGTK